MKSFLLLLIGLVGHAVAECDLECFNDVPCVNGTANFDEHPQHNGKALPFHEFTSSPEGYHCECPEDKTGLKCARQYESCKDSDHSCYNGGKCILGQPDLFSNDHYFCDCTKAKDENGTKYVGKFCEIAVDSGSVETITKCDEAGEFFCVNGKECKQNYQDTPRVPCRCGEDFEGPHCEFTKGSVPSCDMSCENHGKCRLGIKSYEQAALGYDLFWEQEIDQMYCECPEGFFGPLCEVESEVCNNHHCFHGAKCIEAKHSNGTINKGCDCNPANGGGKFYGGEYCQYETTVVCESNSEDVNGKAVCFNGGTCTTEGPHANCECVDPFRGHQCERHDDFTSSFHTCGLDCKQGQCRKGVKSSGFFEKFGKDVSHLVNQTNTFAFEHCVCPENLAGVDCGIQVEKCGNDEHVCLHGSTCTMENGEHKCDCDDAHNGLSSFAGVFCQHQSTDICTNDGKLGVGAKNKLAFCVNGGKCKGTAHSEQREHPGCNCPDEFEGVHCELLAGTLDSTAPANDSPDTGDDGKNKGMIAFGSVAAFVVVVIAGLVLHRSRSTRKEHDSGDHTVGSQTTADPVVDVGPEKDFDGNELENVEIL